MSSESRKKALNFLKNEKQFHLGFLPTEQSNPLTRNMDKEFAKSTVEGVRNLQSPDRSVLEMFRQCFASAPFKKLVDDGITTIRDGGKIVFSGCGATGRLSILLESMWRRGCKNNSIAAPFANQVLSIMTGGDYALIKSVEAFEDYQQFGRRQVQDLGIGAGDMLIAITEGGETSSVLGTIFEALDRDLKVFLMFNNPAELLSKYLERSRKAICDSRVTILDLSCGPMALAGSTRMQATTSEQLVAGSALEMIMDTLLGNPLHNYPKEFEQLLNQLEIQKSRQMIADYIDFEADVYKKNGLVTYFSGEYLLDIFTDTTERSPTFMLPSFRKNDDHIAPRPWAFVKHPFLNTLEVWEHNLNRKLRCLDWNKSDYITMNAPATIQDNPPAINTLEMLKFEVGNENIFDRTVTGRDVAVVLTTGCAEDVIVQEKVFQLENSFQFRKVLAIGKKTQADFFIPVENCSGILNLMMHIAVKLVLNTISTGTMAIMGRISGNWMSWVAISNKKLIDRAIRLIAELGNISYKKSCYLLFESIEEMEKVQHYSISKHSIVQYTLKKLNSADI